MNDSEELKHAHARIEADGKTIAELRAMLKTLSGHSNQLVNQGVEMARLKDVYRLKLQAMHRRAQRAESRLDRLKREHASLASFKPAPLLESLSIAPYMTSDHGRIQITDERFSPPPIVTNASQCGKTRTAQAWAWTRIKPFYDKRLGEPWTQPEPEIFEARGLEWYRHTGDEMPCDGGVKVRALLTGDRGDLESMGGARRAGEFNWRTEHINGDIIGWRPADAPEKLPRVATLPVRPNAAACGQCADKL